MNTQHQRYLFTPSDLPTRFTSARFALAPIAHAPFAHAPFAHARLAHAPFAHTCVPSQLCLKELDWCKKNSIATSFLSIQCQRYGYRPLLRRIEQPEFEFLLAEGHRLQLPVEHLSTLRKCYKVDANSHPPLSFLQPKPIILPDILSPDPELHRNASNTWWNDYEVVMHETLQKCAQALPPHLRARYERSVTETEVENGILSPDVQADTTLLFVRDFEGPAIPFSDPPAEEPTDRMSRIYNDTIWSPEGTSKDLDSEQRQRALRERIAEKMPQSNCFYYKIPWAPSSGEWNANDWRDITDNIDKVSKCGGVNKGCVCANRS